MKETDKRRWLEITAVIATGAMKYVLMDWLNLRVFYIAAACIFWSGYIYKRYRVNEFILQQWGFRKDNLKKTFLFSEKPVFSAFYTSQAALDCVLLQIAISII